MAGETKPLADISLPITKTDPICAGRNEVRYVDIGSVDRATHTLANVVTLAAKDAPSRARQVLKAGDTVFSTVRPYLEKIAYIDAALEGEFASTGFCVLRPGPQILPRYLYHFATAREMLDQVLVHQRGVSYPAVLDQHVKAARIPLPPIDEQRRIVEVLEDHLSRLDAGTFQVSSAERRLETWKHQSLDGLVREMASGRTTLGAVVRRVEAGRSFGGSAPPARAEEWGIIKVSAMTWGVFRPEENKAVRGDKIDPRYEIRAGDVLVSRANTTEYVGAPVFVQETRARLLLSDKSLRIVPADGIEARWLATVLAARSTRRQVSRLATGTKDSMRNISQQALLSVTVPSATPAQQAQVVERAVLIEQSASRLRSELATVEARAKALRRAVLSAAFSGRLSERTYLDSTEEFAGV